MNPPAAVEKVAGLVIVVDDAPSVRRALSRLLRSNGLRVETFATAEEFLARGRLPRSVCVVLDLRMPGMGGLELQVRLAAVRPELPVVVITGQEDETLRQEALARGAFAFFYKPIDEEDLLVAISQALGSMGRKT